MKNIFLFIAIVSCFNIRAEKLSYYQKPHEDFSIYDKKYGTRSYPLAYFISRSDLIIIGKVDDEKSEGDVNILVEEIIASTLTKEDLKKEKIKKGSGMSIYTKPARATVHSPSDPLLHKGCRYLFFLKYELGKLKLTGGWQAAISFSSMNDISNKRMQNIYKRHNFDPFEMDRKYLKDLYGITDVNEWLKATKILAKKNRHWEELKKMTESKEKIYSESAWLLLQQQKVKKFEYFGEKK
jgi:hypothetical protein